MLSKTLRLTTLCVFSLSAAACGPDSDADAPDNSVNDHTDDHNGDSDETDQNDDNHDDDQNNADCTRTTFPVAVSNAGQIGTDPEKPWFRYAAYSTDTAPGDILSIDSYQGSPYFGPAQPGSYSFEGSNYADCALCAIIWYNCNENYECERAFLADEGTLNIDALDGVDSTFRGTLNGVVFREVTIDPETYVSTPVSGGETWCLDRFDLQATVEQW